MMDANPSYPLFTLAFDREGYSPAFFKRLWEEHRIAVLTYRKNMKEDDLWDEAEFKEMEVETRLGKTRMKLQEKDISNLNHSIKKKREQLSRKKADLYDHQLNIPQEEKTEPVSKEMGNWIAKQFEYCISRF